MGKTAPVTKLPPDPQRYKIELLISFGFPIRPIGTFFETFFSFSFVPTAKLVIGDAKGPGAKALTVIFLVASSFASILVI